MIRWFDRLSRWRMNNRGTTALEFALVAPVLLMLLIGIIQLGILFYVQAGLKSTVEDAARYATLWPTPSQAQIEQRIASHRFGMDIKNTVGPTVIFSENQTPNFVTISMSCNVTLDYIFGEKTLVLSESRRAYVAK